MAVLQVYPKAGLFLPLNPRSMLGNYVSLLPTVLHRYRHILGLWQPDIGPYGGLLNVVVSGDLAVVLVQEGSTSLEKGRQATRPRAFLSGPDVTFQVNSITVSSPSVSCLCPRTV